MPKPKRNTHTINTRDTIPVNLFKPFSALFCDVNIWAAFPMPAIPSPLGECISIKTINNTADTTCNVQTSVNIFSPFWVDVRRSLTYNFLLMLRGILNLHLLCHCEAHKRRGNPFYLIVTFPLAMTLNL